MSKKMLKRSLALGALMAFAITGSVFAETYELPTIDAVNVNEFKTKSGLDGSCSDPNNSWTVFVPKEDATATDELVTTGDVKYSGGPLGLYAAYFLEDKNKTAHPDPRLDNPNGNTLKIKHNLTVNNGDTYLYGAGTGWGYDGDGKSSSAENNSVYVGGGDKQITIEASGNIYIGGAISVSSKDKHNVIGNTANVDNVKFKSGQYVSIWGGLGQCGSAEGNEAIVKDIVIDGGNVAQIIGGITTDKSGNANNNAVSIEGNSKITGEVYGGYSAYGIASNNTINIKGTADVSKADLYGDNGSAGTGNTLNIESGWEGAIGSVQNFDVINMNKGADVTFGNALDANTVVNLNGATWNVEKEGNKVGSLNCNNGKIVFGQNGHLDIDGAGSGEIILTEAGKNADNLNDAAGLTTVAEKLGVSEAAKETITAKVVMAEGDVKGETTGDVVFEDSGEYKYYHGEVKEVTEKVNTKNQAIGDAGVALKLHWRSHVNDMNKRMGELRNAEGEHGVWTRVVRGESEYKNTKAQYNQYQLGYDEKLSVDKRWTVGAAVTFAEGDANYGQGSTDDKSTAFAIYGSKLNNDGTFVDLIARYAHLESDLDDVNSGKGNYSTNGMSVSAEFGKRIQQGKGLWVEPQVELTYGTIDSAEFIFDGGKTVQVGDMDSLIGRVGFRIGKDLEQGNVYARASYLYDFEGETENTFSNATDSRTIAEDLGGGWWEVGVGANINLSKATYIYADVEKTFGGEVDTNWQWNLGVRYSF